MTNNMNTKVKTILLVAFLLLLIGNNPLQAQEKVENSPSMVQQVTQWYDTNMNYSTITLLMTVESSLVPFPSEIVIPPAAYVASKPENSMNIYLVVLFGTLGALLGAYINYFLSMWLGRPIMYRFADSKMGRMLLLNREKMEKAENYFNSHGAVSTFVGRLIPGIRQLISIPAGLSKMNLFTFSFYTVLGAGIWNSVLALLGYWAHGQADLIEKYSHELSYAILGLFMLVLIYWVAKFLWKRGKSEKR